MVGGLLCLALMVYLNWFIALAAVVMAIGLALYIDSRNLAGDKVNVITTTPRFAGTHICFRLVVR